MSLPRYAELVADSHPAIRKLLDDHVEYYEELLETLWLSEVARWCSDHFLSGDILAVQRVLDAVEQAWTVSGVGDRNTIATGFAEHLPATYAPAGRIVRLLGPNLATTHRRVRH